MVPHFHSEIVIRKLEPFGLWDGLDGFGSVKQPDEAVG